MGSSEEVDGSAEGSVASAEDDGLGFFGDEGFEGGGQAGSGVEGFCDVQFDALVGEALFGELECSGPTAGVDIAEESDAGGHGVACSSRRTSSERSAFYRVWPDGHGIGA